MKFEEFVQQQIILPRLRQTGVLVVYDPALRYHGLYLGLANESRAVVDARAALKVAPMRWPHFNQLVQS